MRGFLFLLFFLSATPVFAQLGFCEGSKGDPIFHETFGTGNTSGPALPPTVTNYTYVTGDPNDGQYTISGKIGQNNTTWHSFLPSSTVSDGRALIVNASFTSGQFYRTEITGLCQNTSYEFSAFLMNVYDRSSGICENGGIPINVRFEIWDQTETSLLKEGSTGDLQSTNSPQWQQFALTFQSEAGQGSVILKMFNNGVGGCGNDLAIDDIIFRSCGDLTEVSDASSNSSGITVCWEDAPVSLDLKAISDSSVYSDHFYQWQQSSDNSTWTDISGETADSFQSPPLSSSTYYRVKVAEDPANLQNNLCSSASEAFFVEIIPTPLAPVSSGNVETCSNQEHPGLRVQAEADEAIDWYDSPTGGSLVAENSNPFYPETSGTYYAEAHKTGTSCAPGPRTAVEFTIYPAPAPQDEVLYLCTGTSIELDAGLENQQYEWSTGATSRSITVSGAGIYEVKITNSLGCSSTKTVEVVAVETPVIQEVVSEGRSVSILLENQGDFLYSLDGSNFQASPLFPSVKGGIYTAYVKNLAGCSVETLQFAHLVLPEYITPNNDGYHDYFELKGVSFFGSSEIRIFDRYGKLLASGPGANFRWDGNLRGQALPEEDYWYAIDIEGFETIKGNFSLLR